VLDYSKYLVDFGQKLAKQEGLKIEFIEADARNSSLATGRFQFIIIMASSFGYFPDEDENQKILIETVRMLDNKGTLFLDLPSRDYVINKFKPFSSHKVNDDLTATRKRELGDDIIYSQETVVSKTKGLIRDRSYCTRLYSPEKITKLLKKAGYSSVSCQNNFMNRETGLDYGCMTNRMVVMAHKDFE
jgi:SAM-dependent methyltransferase